MSKYPSKLYDEGISEVFCIVGVRDGIYRLIKCKSSLLMGCLHSMYHIIMIYNWTCISGTHIKFVKLLIDNNDNLRNISKILFRFTALSCCPIQASLLNNKSPAVLQLLVINITQQVPYLEVVITEYSLITSCATTTSYKYHSASSISWSSYHWIFSDNSRSSYELLLQI